MRIQVNLSDDMVKRVDMIAKTYGVTRSGLLATLIGQAVTQTEAGLKLAKNLVEDASFQEKLIKAVENA